MIVLAGQCGIGPSLYERISIFVAVLVFRFNCAHKEMHEETHTCFIRKLSHLLKLIFLKVELFTGRVAYHFLEIKL